MPYFQYINQVNLTYCAIFKKRATAGIRKITLLSIAILLVNIVYS